MFKKGKSRILLLLVISFLASLQMALSFGLKSEENPGTDAKREESALLPDKFLVYFSYQYGVLNHPEPGFERRILPTVNDFRGAPGCYVACYSRSKEDSIYPVGGNIFVMGQVRVQGTYSRRVCLPGGFETADISASSYFHKVCQRHIPACRTHGCWAGGDTGGWFGIQQ